MTRHWAPLDRPQRAVMNWRARRDGRPRTAVDLELPLMALLAILVGIGVVVWLNGQGTPGSGELRRVTERPQIQNPREALAAGEAQRAAAARKQARVRRVRAARRLAERRATLAAAASRRNYAGDQRYTQDGYPITGTGTGYGTGYQTPGYAPNGQTYTQQQQQVQPNPAPAPAKPRPKRSGGGGGGGQFDDSG